MQVYHINQSKQSAQLRTINGICINHFSLHDDYDIMVSLCKRICAFYFFVYFFILLVFENDTVPLLLHVPRSKPIPVRVRVQHDTYPWASSKSIVWQTGDRMHLRHMSYLFLLCTRTLTMYCNNNLFVPTVSNMFLRVRWYQRRARCLWMV